MLLDMIEESCAVVLGYLMGSGQVRFECEAK
jgi:hypothetical protein